MSFSENPLSNPPTHLILFTNTGCPIYFIYFGVTLTILPLLIYTYAGIHLYRVFHKKVHPVFKADFKSSNG